MSKNYLASAKRSGNEEKKEGFKVQDLWEKKRNTADAGKCHPLSGGTLSKEPTKTK